MYKICNGECAAIADRASTCFIKCGVSPFPSDRLKSIDNTL